MSNDTRADRKRRTREALIAAGCALFAEQGLDAPSLDSICDRAGFTRGAFYVHFRDRDDFIAAVMEWVSGPILDAILGGTGGELDLHESVARFMQAFADGTYPLSPKGGIKPHQLLQACARSPSVRERYVNLITDSIERVAQSTARSQSSKALDDELDPQAVAALMVAAVIGVQIMEELNVPFDLPATALTLVRALSR